MAGVYFHVPFCKKACHYCDFHFSTVHRSRAEMVEAMALELAQMATSSGLKEVSTIYFGGGTPSLLEPGEVQRLIREVRHHWPLTHDAEITLEANPDDLTEAYAESLLEAGINRLSIGIQSFYSHHLAYMNRAHTAEQALRCITLVQEAGFSNITTDLIYGVPILTPEEWKYNVQTLVESGVQHISAYCLTIEAGTYFGHQKKKGLMDSPPDAHIREQYNVLTDALRNAGFEHYEISNFGKPGYRSRHNSGYWNGECYLGIGPGAHSYDGLHRRWNVRNNPVYLQKVAAGSGFFESETLTATDRMNEYLLVSLRTAAGAELVRLAQLGWTPDSIMLQNIQEWKSKAWLMETPDRIALTEEGFLMADYIASELFIV
jgi:oxygen-independent coproporphyrinogen III oxidase